MTATATVTTDWRTAGSPSLPLTGGPLRSTPRRATVLGDDVRVRPADCGCPRFGGGLDVPLDHLAQADALIAVVPANDAFFAPWYSRGSVHHRRVRLLAEAGRAAEVLAEAGASIASCEEGGRNGEIRGPRRCGSRPWPRATASAAAATRWPASPRVCRTLPRGRPGCGRPRPRSCPPGVPLTHLLNRPSEATPLEPRSPHNPARGPGCSRPFTGEASFDLGLEDRARGADPARVPVARQAARRTA